MLQYTVRSIVVIGEREELLTPLPARPFPAKDYPPWEEEGSA